MAKSRKEKTQFVCQNCGYASPRWQGKCPSCNEWNTFVEEKVAPSPASNARIGRGSDVQAIVLDDIKTDQTSRHHTISGEFNRVLGGGIVAGSVILVGGDPGIGKSTLLLQEAAGLSENNFKVLYITGEESVQQVKMRAQRLSLSSADLYIMAETDLDSALEKSDRLQPNLLIVDSIQTMYTNKLVSAPGSVGQVRECALQLIQVAKSKGIPVFLVGHVTKEGYLAGPKVLEHMVDALLLFEGDRDHFYRILRAVKNRFGSTREIGVFEMNEHGLRDVPNPSAVFLAERRAGESGSAVICCMEGTRPILVEVQALATTSNYGLPQRSSIGFDVKRANMLLAVLEKRLGFRMGTMDVFINAVGGMRIDETAADLGVITCIASSVRNRSLDGESVILGEVGLGGEIRSVAHIDSRLSEAEKMGFKRAVIPGGNTKNLSHKGKIQILPVSTAQQALDIVLQ